MMDFLKKDLFHVNGFHITIGVVVLVVVVYFVWKRMKK
jgi:hypothetical protein